MANVHSSFICNNQKLETTQMSFNGWMIKEIVVYLYLENTPHPKGINYCTWKTGIDLKGIMLSEKKPISKGSIAYDSIYKTLFVWQNYRE